jgi:RNA polymerase sigma-32 factor
MEAFSSQATEPTRGGYGRFLALAGKFEPLTREEEQALARAARDGDRQAADRLVCSSLRYVIKLAGQYRGYGLRPSDLVEEGILGLLEAVKRFDPDRNLRLMTYASHWVRAYILSFVLKQSSIVGMGTGPTSSRLFFRLARERQRLAQEVPANELEGALAVQLNASPERVADMTQRLATRDAWLDAPTHSEGTTSMLDNMVDETVDLEREAASAQRDAQVRRELVRLWPQLDARERILVSERLSQGEDGVSLADLGRRLGVSRERMRQLECRVKAKLKRALQAVDDRAA